MQGLRLLEKIKRYDETPELRGIWDAEEIAGSILRHLISIFNTRHGSAMIADDIGMPDFTNLAGSFNPETYAELERHLRTVVEKYEPRLAEVAVMSEQTEDKFSLTFTLEGKIRLQTGEIPISFETIIDPEGKIELTR